MSGPQFIHVQTFSRKANPVGQSIEQVIKEALRDPDYCRHVPSPKPPELLDGIALEALRAEHDAMVDAAVTVAQGKNGPIERRLREDQHTLFTMVASYPVPIAKIVDDEARDHLQRWRSANIAFFKKVMGASYRTTIEHADEAHPHLHAYGLPAEIDGCDAKQLHPGKVAKADAIKAARQAAVTGKAIAKAGNRALQEEMRAFQDDYFLEVAEPLGLLRDGPRRPRLNRGDYQREKARAALKTRSVLEAERDRLDRDDAALKAGREEMENTAATQAAKWDELEAERFSIDREKAELKTRKAELDAVTAAQAAERVRVEVERAKVERKTAVLKARRDEMEKADAAQANERARLEAERADVDKRVDALRKEVAGSTIALLAGILDGRTALDGRTGEWHFRASPDDPPRPCPPILHGPLRKLSRPLSTLFDAVETIGALKHDAERLGLNWSQRDFVERTAPLLEAIDQKVRDGLRPDPEEPEVMDEPGPDIA